MKRPRRENMEFSEEETQKRFEAALRGARIAGHKEMRDIAPKRSPSKPAKPTKSKKGA